MCGAIKEDLEVMGGRSRHRHQGHLWLHPINAAALLCLRQDGDSHSLRAILWVKWLVSVVVTGRTWDKRGGGG